MELPKKSLGADAAAVESARSAEAVPQLSHATPGPWQIDREEFDEGDGRQIPIVASDFLARYGIADVRHWSGKPENWANAHLIAAAPELLGALKYARSVIEIHTKNSCSGCKQALKPLDAAIAKAEGRS